MTIIKFIKTIFKIKTTSVYNSDVEINLKKQKWEATFNDTGIFKYTDPGFDIDLEEESYSIKWTDIERLQAYKADIIVVDEICIDITFNNKTIIITEETAGWYQFIKKIKPILVLTNSNWEASVIKSPLEYDLTTIYEREDRRMPLKPNFYSVIKYKEKDDIIDIFENHGWTIRKSGMDSHELANSWTDLVLDSDNNSLLLHGLVAYHPDNIIVIKNLFEQLNTHYKFEFYNDNNEIIEHSQNDV